MPGLAPPLVSCPHTTRQLVNAVDDGLCPICSAAEAADLRERVAWAEALLRPVAGAWGCHGKIDSQGWERWERNLQTGWQREEDEGYCVAHVIRWWPLQGPGWQWAAFGPLGQKASGVVGTHVEFEKPKFNQVESWRREAMRRADRALRSWGVYTREAA